MCFGPLEVQYDYDKIASSLSREKIESRAPSVWRYQELLPIDGTPNIGLYSGYTPLVKADRLAEALGVKELYVKDDSVNHPTFSYKDRVVSVAISKAIEFGFDTVSCASTGNLANSVSAHAARAGLRCFIFIPDNLERGKVIGSTVYDPTPVAISGTYDDVNRLCTEIADKYQWAFVNINIRPFYTEGAKTYGFEVAQSRRDHLGLCACVHDGFQGLAAVAGHADDDGFIARDSTLIDEFLRDGDGRAAGGLGEDAFRLREQSDRRYDFCVRDGFAPAAALANGLEYVEAVGGIPDRDRFRDGVRFYRFDQVAFAMQRADDGGTARSLRRVDLRRRVFYEAYLDQFLESLGDFRQN
jgi:hypothetical protein